nr:MAG TPA: hypothetical protein [Caudoviricetes sp.]
MPCSRISARIDLPSLFRVSTVPPSSSPTSYYNENNWRNPCGKLFYV